MIWRCGVAGLLVITLIALVADLWSGDPRDATVAERVTSSHSRFGRADTGYTAGHSSAPSDRSGTVAPAADPDDGDVRVLRVEANAAGAADSSAIAVRMRDDFGSSGGVLDYLDLTRLPRASAGAGVEEERALEPVEAAPTPAEPPQPLDGEATSTPWTVPVPRPKRGGQTAAGNAGARQAAAVLPEKGPAPRPASAFADAVTDAQRKLIALGYDIGPADGRWGRRAEAAVLDFQRSTGLNADGRLSKRLLARLDAELRLRAQRRQQERQTVAAAPPRPEPEQQRGLFASMMGGLQRLVGRDFDSVRRPEESAAYCRANPDTWVYDFGREAFVFCGNINAGGSTGYASAKALETASGR